MSQESLPGGSVGVEGRVIVPGILEAGMGGPRGLYAEAQLLRSFWKLPLPPGGEWIKDAGG